ncbi:MAG: hypothetical protein IT306_14195 [Chloroflexi bacterium]|nr:hypothetical protein [Chloroflexota bacterium]
MNVLNWLLDGDPAIRWQALRDLAGAPAEIVAAERARVVSEGWGAQLLALQGDDGLWDGGALFPARNGVPDVAWHTQNLGQPWTATEPTLTLLSLFGVDPAHARVRRAVEQIRDRCRWEHEGQRFFDGEVEPCINGRTVSLGVYFGQDVSGIVARLLAEQLEDGGWNCEAERGTVRSSFDTTINVLEGLLEYFRSAGDPPDARIDEAIALLRAKQQPDGRWLLEMTYRGKVYSPLEGGDGQPSRWNTLRALRVLAWYDRPTRPPRAIAC